ncbi:MAG: lactate racemase domain-containing protein [Trueperaceae bacterium]|nr:lactate racemase domain-containing protein [Trueperaceae bacterium]
MRARAVADAGATLPHDRVREALHQAFGGAHDGERVLVLIPDHTRSLPLPMLFRTMVDALDGARELTFMVALGTHPPLEEDRLNDLVGLSAEERQGRYRHVRLENHAWNDPAALTSLGTLPRARIQEIAGDRWHPTLGGDVDVRINRAVVEHDHVIILGPTFPHEVVGFSGGTKYFFPGVSEADMINVTHWLGALGGVRRTIGVADTPVRAMIDAAFELLPTEATLAALVVDGGELAGTFVGAPREAWPEAVALSAQRHVRWVDAPFQRVLSVAPPMYDELWTAGKAMYKLEPALAEGGELIIHAPHLREVSRVHGRWIREIGYHVLPYFLEQWDRFSHVPLGVLAHSTHVRGDGRFEDGVEKPRAQVTLASRIPKDETEALGLGWMDPDAIDVTSFQDREDEGILYVPKAGETLFKVRGQA